MEIRPQGINNDDLKDEIREISKSVKGLEVSLKNEIESQITKFLDGLIYRLSKAKNIKALHSDNFTVWDIKEDENIFKPLLETFDDNFVHFEDNENARNEKGYLKTLISSDKILILSPKNVDGDSLGSGAMLARLAQSLGKEVKIASPIDTIPHKWSFLFPENVEFISWDRGKKETAMKRILEFAPDMVISPDTSDLDVYKFGEKDTFIIDLLNALKTKVIKLDHHQEGTFETNFGSFNVVLPTAPSTGAMVLSTILKLNSVTKDFFTERPWLKKVQLISMDQKMRDLLAFTLISDSFGLERVREPRQFFKILNYLKDGSSYLNKEQILDLEKLSSHFQCEDEKSLALFFKGIENAEIKEENGWKFLISFISLEELNEIGNPNLQDAELLKSELGHLGDDIDFVILGIEQKAFREGENNPIKMTLRQSSNEVANFHAGDVAQKSYGGGGHKDTSGWSCSVDFSQQVSRVLDIIGEKTPENSFPLNSFDLSKKQKSIINKLNSYDNFDEANEYIKNNLKEQKQTTKEESKEIATAILSFILEHSSFLQENINNEPRLLHIIDACLAKGASYEQASHRLIRNNFKDLNSIKEMFKEYDLSHMYLEKEFEKFAINYNLIPINQDRLDSNQKKFISFLRRSTLSTENNTQLSIIKFCDDYNNINFKTYQNGVKLKDFHQRSDVQEINDLINHINNESISGSNKNHYKEKLINKVL